MRRSIYPLGPYQGPLETKNGNALYAGLSSSLGISRDTKGRVFVLTDGTVSGAFPPLRQVSLPAAAGGVPGQKTVACEGAEILLLSVVAFTNVATGTIYPNITAEFFLNDEERVSDEHPLGGLATLVQFAPAGAPTAIQSSNFAPAMGWVYSFAFDKVIFRNYTTVDSAIIRGMWATDRTSLNPLTFNPDF